MSSHSKRIYLIMIMEFLQVMSQSSCEWVKDFMMRDSVESSAGGRIEDCIVLGMHNAMFLRQRSEPQSCRRAVEVEHAAISALRIKMDGPTIF